MQLKIQQIFGKGDNFNPYKLFFVKCMIQVILSTKIKL